LAYAEFDKTYELGRTQAVSLLEIPHGNSHVIPPMSFALSLKIPAEVFAASAARMVTSASE
jgi:hypothetical protein